MIIGQLVHERLSLAEGEKATLKGRAFTVEKVHPLRGNEDDITVWIPLADAQELLGKPGRINAILALSCFCAEATLDGIRKEIGTALEQQVQVLELAPQAATRRAARARAAEHGGEAISAVADDNDQLRREREALAAWAIPLVIVACIVWVGLLAFGNVRDRRGEIGILRALGVRARQVFAVFLVKAILVGLLGAAAGYVAGFGLASGWYVYESRTGVQGVAAVFGPALLAATLVVAPLLSALAALVPALMAAQQDPADVLREG
jgi:putative ABC transport system permease protein